MELLREEDLLGCITEFQDAAGGVAEELIVVDGSAGGREKEDERLEVFEGVFQEDPVAGARVML